MIKIKATVNGKEVPLSKFGSAIEQAVYTKTAESIRQKLAGVKCPVHGATLDALILKKAGGGAITFDLEGCCQELSKACQAALS